MRYTLFMQENTQTHREQVIFRTLLDPKVHDALDDLVRATYVYGREGVTGENLLNVITHRLLANSEENGKDSSDE